MEMIRICPSILNANFNDLPNEISKVAQFSDLLHLDVMDGKFVPNSTFSFEQAREIIGYSILPVDVHLMIEQADRYAIDYIQTAAFSITVHFEACDDPLNVLRSIRKSGKRAGLAIKPNTQLTAIENLLNEIDMLLVMTVEPGFGGQSFIESMVPKIEKAREWLREHELTDTWLQVDGGINLETIQIARKAGADTFVAGSVVYKSENPAATIQQLRKLAEAV
jgi:ribulose-phosphate 3-epimerase